MTTARPVLTNRHFVVLTAAFTIFVIYGSFVPLTMRSLSSEEAARRYAKAMSQPVRLQSKSDFAANVILFVPLGFLAAGAVGVDRKRPLAQIALIPAMAALSALIEYGQLWFPDRNTTINDVVAETLGGAVGVGIWLLRGQLATDRFRTAWNRLGPGDWAIKALPAYVFFLVVVHGMPFDLTLSPWQIKKKYDNGLEIDAADSGAPTIAVAPYPRQVFEKSLLNVAYFLPVGALLAQLPARRWRMCDSAGHVLLFGFGIALGIEAVQLIVLSAGTYATDVIMGSLLILAGWWLAIQSRPISRRTWGIAAAIWSIALAACFWWPFAFAPNQFADRLTASEWMLFADYFRGNYIGAFNRMINKLVLFAPLGFCFCRAREVSAASGAILGALVGSLIELGQPAFTSQHASTSDIMLAAAGAGAGALIAIRARQS